MKNSHWIILQVPTLGFNDNQENQDRLQERLSRNFIPQVAQVYEDGLEWLEGTSCGPWDLFRAYRV